MNVRPLLAALAVLGAGLAAHAAPASPSTLPPTRCASTASTSTARSSRYDERLTGRAHRYGYGYAAGVAAAGIRTGDSILKHDVVAGTRAVRRLGAGREVSEFCFVPSAPDSAEDDGVLMAYVYDRSTDRSDLVLLDAETLDDVAAVHLPGRVPAGFHGDWAPTA